MKKTILLLLLFHLSFCGLIASTPDESELKSEQDSVDFKFLKTWKSFVTAILDFDKIKLFNDFIKTKIADSTNWRIYDEGEQNRRMFYKDCISKNSNIDIAKIKVVSIKTFETTADYEGAALLLSFIETKDGYKFCRYNTNP